MQFRDKWHPIIDQISLMDVLELFHFHQVRQGDFSGKLAAQWHWTKGMYELQRLLCFTAQFVLPKNHI